MNFAQSGGIVMKDQSKSGFYLPFSFMITSFIALFVFAILFIVGGPLFSGGLVRTPQAIASVHLFILGFATMLAMGAVYQLVPVVINEKLHSMKLGAIHYFFYTAGCIGLLVGFFQFNTTVIITSALVTIIGVIIFIANIMITISKVQSFNSILFATVSSFFYLLLTVISGLIMGLNFAFQTFSAYHMSILVSHIWFGLIGWFLFLIIGYSFKMLPMFYLAHGFSQRIQPWILATLHVSLLVLTINFFFSISNIVTLIGIGLLLVALSLYRYHIYQIQSKKFKRNPGKGITITVYAVDALIVVTFISLIAIAIDPSIFRSLDFLTAICAFYLFGWVGVTILGYLSKIVPFLWWTFSFGDRVGKENVPSLHEMVDEKVVFTRLIVLLIAIIGLSIGILTQISLLITTTQIMLGLAIVYYLIHIVKIFSYS